ncbi:unnamed protein product [Phytomonas sp. Hart1]|nr:unnamed protein product [Phytomonas sp. Hart1]|eukprot:CCW66463.1 unnamed protein product [Phytomonas sp. isolate Hart1]
MLSRGDVVGFIETALDAARLTTDEAEAIVKHLRASAGRAEAAWAAIAKCLYRTAGEGPGARARPGWAHDLRFYGEWWLTLRPSDAVESRRARYLLQAGEGGVYASLLPQAARQGEQAKDELISDLALRLHGPLYHLTLLHLDCFDMNPGRMLVFLFNGILPLKRNICEAAKLTTREEGEVESLPDGSGKKTSDPEALLGTLSFSNCNIGTASLMVILLALAEDGETARTTALDLSCNCLTNNSLECFTALLKQTKVKKLDLRHNYLYAPWGTELLSFLEEGCSELTELSLCSTGLSHAQIRLLLHALPGMPNLRVLLLNHLDIPLEMALEVHSAVQKSRLQYLSLVGCAVNNHPTLMQKLVACCAKNRQAEGVGMDFSPNASFFEEHLKRMEAKGWTPLLHRSSLSIDFEPYTNNDPSLFSVFHSIN